MAKARVVILAAVCAGVLSSLAACQRDTLEVDKQLALLAQSQKELKAQVEKDREDIQKRLDDLDAAVKSKAVARPAQRRQTRPNPSTTYAVPISGAPFEGPANAKVTIVKGFEFACPFCKRVNGTLEQLRTEYQNDLRIVYKHYIVHPQTANVPAYAACAAGRQGKFSKMKDLIWSKGFDTGRDFSRVNMDRLAKEAQLDMARYRKDMGGACKRIVSRDQQQLSAVGTRGTPAFYINGRYLSGAQPIKRFKTLIDEELKKANQRIANGGKLATYYAEYVLKKGKKRL